MTCIIDTKSNRHMSAKLAAIVALGSSVGSARAQQHGDNHHGQDNHGQDNHGQDHHGGGGPDGWNGGGRGGGGAYYATPPVIYGGPVYYAPPVVYGPAVGIVLPGVAIGIQ